MKNPFIWIAVVIVLLGGLMYFLSRSNTGPSGAVTTDLRADDWTRGAPSAPVNLLEYGDFQCPACATYEPILQKMEAELGAKLSFTFRHFPLVQIHQNALSSAIASEAAGKQGKFWEMHDILYKKQSEWSESADAASFYTVYARSLGLDEAQFSRDLKDSALRKKVETSMQEALAMGLNATPTFFVNGTKIAAPRNADDLKALLEAAAVSTSTQPKK